MFGKLAVYAAVTPCVAKIHISMLKLVKSTMVEAASGAAVPVVHGDGNRSPN